MIDRARSFEKGGPKPAGGPERQNMQSGPQPLINFQYYQPPKPPQLPKAMQPYTYMPINLNNPLLPNLSNQYAYAYDQPIMPIINNYTIETNGPMGKFKFFNKIFEDQLPDYTSSAMLSTLRQRLLLYNFIRSTIFSGDNGNSIMLDNGPNSLLSRIKFNEFNQYRLSDKIHDNLKKNFLIYRSCYPIRKDTHNSDVVCARDSTSVNIRLYKMDDKSVEEGKKSEYSKLSKSPMGLGQIEDYKEWRDVLFYQYIYNEIIKKNVSPNFVFMYGYSISEQSKIPYKEIDDILNNVTINANQLVQTISRMDAAVTDASKKLIDDAAKKKKEQTDKDAGKIANINNTYITNQSYYDNPDLKIVNKSLVLLTESPTYIFKQWIKKSYISEGTTYRMVSRGSHSDDEWYNIMFQIMVALYVMQKKGIIIHDFSLDKNVYIKDLPINSPVPKFWIYRIDGVDFYLPNCGYLVMIDSDFSDINDDVLQKIERDNRSKVEKIMEDIKDEEGRISAAKSDVKSKKSDAESKNTVYKEAEQKKIDKETEIEELKEEISNAIRDPIKSAIEDEKKKAIPPPPPTAAVVATVAAAVATAVAVAVTAATIILTNDKNEITTGIKSHLKKYDTDDLNGLVEKIIKKILELEAQKVGSELKNLNDALPALKGALPTLKDAKDKADKALSDEQSKLNKIEKTIATKQNELYKLNITSKQNLDGIIIDKLYTQTNVNMFSNFKKIFNNTTFNFTKTDPELVNPNPDIISLVNRIQIESETVSNVLTDEKAKISHYIFHFMGMFLHNRIGTQLRIQEITAKGLNPTKSDEKKIVLKGTDCVLLYKVDSSDSSKTIIISQDTTKMYKSETISLSSLSTISIILNPDAPFTPDNLIETYNVDI